MTNDAKPTSIKKRCLRFGLPPYAWRTVIEIACYLGGKLTDEQKAFNRMLSAVRAIVEHPFRVIKRQFGFTKVRYRGLKKNTGQIVTLFALANLRLARKRLLPLVGEVRP